MTLTRRDLALLGAATLSQTLVGERSADAQSTWVAPAIIPRNGSIKGLAVTPPNYWAAVSTTNPPHYARPPYSGTWDAQNFGFPAARRAAARAAGFNTVRTFLDAGPFMDAATSGALNSMSELLALMINNAVNYINAGFRLVLNYSAQITTPNPNFSLMSIMDGPTGPNFIAYCKGLAAVSAAIASVFTPQQVAIEIINEPPYDWEWGDLAPWSVQAPAMWRYARQAAPHHTLIVQSRSAAWYGALPELNPNDFDANTIFCFHPYEPGGFTSQGIDGNLGLYRVPFPASGNPADCAAQIALMEQRVAAIPGMSAADQQSQIQSNISELQVIYWPPDPMSQPAIYLSWGVIDAWMSQYQLSPLQVLAGEFGVTSDFNYNGSMGCDPVSRAHFYGAIVANVGIRNLAGWIAWQSVGDFNLFEQTSVSEHGDTLIPELVQALGLTVG